MFFYNPNDHYIYAVVNGAWANTGVFFSDDESEYLLIVAGQSNAQSSNEGPLLPEERQPRPNLLMISHGQKTTYKGVPLYYQAGQPGQEIPLQDPLQHRMISHPESVGFARSFCEDFLHTHPKAKITVLPCALGGTGFKPDANYCWDKTIPCANNLYKSMILEVNAVLTKHPNMKVLGTLWLQGENDIGFQAYPAKLDQLIRDLRNDIVGGKGQRCKFVAATMLKFWRQQNPATEYIHQAHLTLSQRFNDGLTACVNCDAFNTYNRNDGMNVHYDADSMRRIGHLLYQTFSTMQ